MQRNLPPKLSLWFNDHAQPYPDTPGKCFIRLALSCTLIRETSPNGGEMVELLQSTVGKAENEPWCMSFVQSLVAYVEKQYHVTSGLAVGENCMDVFARSNSIVAQNPRAGDLIIYRKRNTKNLGHVEIIAEVFLDKAGNTFFHTVAGNTSDGSGVNREGDGVYPKIRPNKDLGSMEIAGFLRPFTWV